MKWSVAGWIGFALPFVVAHAQAQSALPLLTPTTPEPPTPAPSTLERNGLVLGASVGAAYMNALGYSYEARAGWGFANRWAVLAGVDYCGAILDSAGETNEEPGSVRIRLVKRTQVSLQAQFMIVERTWARLGVGVVGWDGTSPTTAEQDPSLSVPVAIGRETALFPFGGSLNLSLAATGWRWHGQIVADAAFRFGFSYY